MYRVFDYIVKKIEESNSDKIIDIITIGRNSNLPRKVTVGFVCYEKNIFLRTSHRTNWYKNLRTNPNLKILVADEKFIAEAELVMNKKL